MRRLPIIVLAGVIAATPAFAAVRHEHKFGLTFSSKTPNSQTGIKFLTDRYQYKAPPQGTAVLRVVTTTINMAPGTRSKTTGFPTCTAAMLTAPGGTCPAKALVGTGSATVVTGIPQVDPALANLKAKVYVKKNGLLTYMTVLGAPQVIELQMKGSKMVAKVPQTCIVKSDCTQGEAVLKVLTISLKKGLITTPAKCPATHKWTNTVTYAYSNGDKESIPSTTPCKG